VIVVVVGGGGGGSGDGGSSGGGGSILRQLQVVSKLNCENGNCSQPNIYCKHCEC
jgi:hypothetical protein